MEWPPELRSALLEGLAERAGPRPTAMCLAPVHPHSAFPTYEARLTFPDGSEGRWFVKDLGHRSRWAQEPARHKECELAVYRHLLRDAPLGTPDLVCDCAGSDGSHWLVLDYVEGTPLKWLGIDEWVSAVQWLGRKDAYFRLRQEELAAVTSLGRLDEAHFTEVADRALLALHRLAPSLTKRLEGVVGYYLGIVEDLLGGAWTLVHGSYRPGQILVRSVEQPGRICPVDWETAAHGSCVCDVASLCEGFEGARLDRLVSSYRDAAMEHGAEVPTRRELMRGMHAHWIHRQLKLVIKSLHRGWAEHVERFVDTAEARVRQHEVIRAHAA